MLNDISDEDLQEDNDGWWFSTGSNVLGPYKTKELAKEAWHRIQKHYCPTCEE